MPHFRRMERASFFESITNLFTSAWWVKALLGLLVFLFGAWQQAYGALVALIVLDFFTGVWASKRRGRPVTSKVMGLKTGQKVGLYGVVIAIANLADKGVPGPDFLLGVALAMLVVAEALSAVENLSRIYPDHPVLAWLRQALGSRLEQLQDKGR